MLFLKFPEDFLPLAEEYTFTSFGFLLNPVAFLNGVLSPLFLSDENLSSLVSSLWYLFAGLLSLFLGEAKLFLLSLSKLLVEDFLSALKESLSLFFKFVARTARFGLLNEFFFFELSPLFSIVLFLSAILLNFSANVTYNFLRIIWYYTYIKWLKRYL